MYASPEKLMVDQTIAHIAGMELIRRKGPTQNNTLTRASLALSAGCIKLGRERVTRRDYRIAMGPPLGILEAITASKRKNKTPTELLQVRQARMLKLGALMIQSRNFPDEVGRLKRRLNRETAQQIGTIVTDIKALKGKEDEKFRGGLNGELADLTALALLNTSEWLDHFGMFAPPHHESMWRPKRNHDVIFGRSTELDETTTQALQVKVACGGFCPDGKTPDPDPRARYSPDVALVSGHCDLGLPYDRVLRLSGRGLQSTGRLSLTIPELLVRAEFSPDQMGAREHRALGDLSEQFVHTIINEGATVRAGTAK